MSAFDRFMLHFYAQDPPKFIQRLEEHNSGPVKMPTLQQVMFVPVAILIYAALFVTESWGIMIGLTVLVLLAVTLIALTRSEPSDRGGWDDVDLP